MFFFSFSLSDYVDA